jgi:hypothetical protein
VELVGVMSGESDVSFSCEVRVTVASDMPHLNLLGRVCMLHFFVEMR